jgi:uncharacterized protein YlxW (UPF0749 family)
LVLGLLLVIQLRTQHDSRLAARSEDWTFVVADLVESNLRLREEIGTLQTQLAELQDIQGGAPVLESLVDEINQLRIANGLVEVSGPGIEILIVGPVSVLDLHDLINEMRNAGAEALSLNGQRIVAWSALSTDGESVTVDGQAVQGPYRLQAIGDGRAMEAALVRPGGILRILAQSRDDISTDIQQKEKLTLPVCRRAMEFGYATPLE